MRTTRHNIQQHCKPPGAAARRGGMSDMRTSQNLHAQHMILQYTTQRFHGHTMSDGNVCCNIIEVVMGRGLKSKEERAKRKEESEASPA